MITTRARTGRPGRERNPERSRERILAAALTEFAANGYAGARVDAIARRAGLNKQLISHHFGGKLGLYRAVSSRRRHRGGEEVGTARDDSVGGVLASFHTLAGADPEWVRVLLWETLERGHVEDLDADVEDPVGDADADADLAEGEDRVSRYRARVAWVEQEQADGRLPADLEPDLLLLSLMGAALYPILLPHVADLVTGRDTQTPAFARRWRAHLRALARAIEPTSEVGAAAGAGTRTPRRR